MSEKLVKKLQKENAELLSDNAELINENIPIKEFHERIKELEKIINYNSNLFEGKITALQKEQDSSLLGTIRNIEAPFVSYKLEVVEGGRSPKTTSTLKVSGAIEELKKEAIESKLTELIAAINSKTPKEKPE